MQRPALPHRTIAAHLKRGGLIAYPTEYCFGLGCDPRNRNAVLRLLIAYLKMLRDNDAPAAPELRGLTATHVYDLIALAIGAALGGLIGSALRLPLLGAFGGGLFGAVLVTVVDALRGDPRYAELVRRIGLDVA